ncbi:MAG: M15 family metallopeptidase, partial [Rhodanobacter sp.]
MTRYRSSARERAPTRTARHRYVLALAWFVAISASGLAPAAPPPVTLSPATTARAANLVDIRTLVPDIAQDIKYAG